MDIEERVESMDSDGIPADILADIPVDCQYHHHH